MHQAAFLFPGQGSQYVGMGKSLYDAHASVRKFFDEASDELRMDLRDLCFAGPAAALAQTENVQPAITLVSLSALQALREDGIAPSVAAGHSLGEYAALCAAGVLSFSATMKLVRFRGEVMRDAARSKPGGMIAVFGLPADAIESVCADARATGVVEIANINSPGQVVLSGEEPAIAEAGRLAKMRGAKLFIRLKVTGAWHSSLMAPAQESLRGKLAEVEFGSASCPVYCNVTGAQYATNSGSVLDSLVQQLVSPVLWSKTMTALIAEGHPLFLEVGPGKVLSGLLKEADRNAKVLNVQDSDTLAQLRQHRAQNKDE